MKGLLCRFVSLLCVLLPAVHAFQQIQWKNSKNNADTSFTHWLPCGLSGEYLATGPAGSKHYKLNPDGSVSGTDLLPDIPSDAIFPGPEVPYHHYSFNLSEVSYVMFVAGEPSTQALYITNCQTTKFITKKAHTITRFMMAFGVEPTGYLGAMFYDSIATKLVTIEAPGIVTEPWGDVSSKFMARNFIEFGFCQGYFFGVSATTDSVEYNIVASGSSDLLPESVADVQLQIPFSSLHLELEDKCLFHNSTDWFWFDPVTASAKLLTVDTDYTGGIETVRMSSAYSLTDVSAYGVGILGSRKVLCKFTKTALTDDYLALDATCYESEEYGCTDPIDIVVSSNVAIFSCTAKNKGCSVLQGLPFVATGSSATILTNDGLELADAVLTRQLNNNKPPFVILARRFDQIDWHWYRADASSVVLVEDIVNVTGFAPRPHQGYRVDSDTAILFIDKEPYGIEPYWAKLSAAQIEDTATSNDLQYMLPTKVHPLYSSNFPQLESATDVNYIMRVDGFDSTPARRFRFGSATQDSIRDSIFRAHWNQTDNDEMHNRNIIHAFQAGNLTVVITVPFGVTGPNFVRRTLGAQGLWSSLDTVSDYSPLNSLFDWSQFDVFCAGKLYFIHMEMGIPDLFYLCSANGLTNATDCKTFNAPLASRLSCVHDRYVILSSGTLGDGYVFDTAAGQATFNTTLQHTSQLTTIIGITSSGVLYRNNSVAMEIYYTPHLEPDRVDVVPLSPLNLIMPTHFVSGAFSTLDKFAYLRETTLVVGSSSNFSEMVFDLDMMSAKTFNVEYIDSRYAPGLLLLRSQTWLACVNLTGTPKLTTLAAATTSTEVFALRTGVYWKSSVSGSFHAWDYQTQYIHTVTFDVGNSSLSEADVYVYLFGGALLSVSTRANEFNEPLVLLPLPLAGPPSNPPVTVTANCVPNTPPTNQLGWHCEDGQWVFDGDFSVNPNTTVIIDGPTIINGSLTLNGTLQVTLLTTINVTNCIYIDGELHLVLTREQVESLTSSQIQTLLQSGSACGIQGTFTAVVVSNEGACEQVTASQDPHPNRLDLIFSVDNSECVDGSQVSPIVLGVSIAAAVAVVIAAVLIVLLVPAIRRKVLPFTNRRDNDN